MARTSYGALPMTTRREIPTRVGSNMPDKYIYGHNPRKSHLSTMEGVPGRIKGGLSSSTAPHKTDMQHFDSKNGFQSESATTQTPGNFGRTGMTGES